MRNFTFATIAAIAVPSLATLVLTIGARSPYTHANLFTQFEPGYRRTEQVVIGPAAPYQGPGPATSLAYAGSQVAQGQVLLVGRACAACHGPEGRGGVVGPPIIGSDADDLRAKTSKGPGGMPAYESLADAELEAIAAYLQSFVR